MSRTGKKNSMKNRAVFSPEEYTLQNYHNEQLEKAYFFNIFLMCKILWQTTKINIFINTDPWESLSRTTSCNDSITICGSLGIF